MNFQPFHMHLILSYFTLRGLIGLTHELNEIRHKKFLAQCTIKVTSFFFLDVFSEDLKRRLFKNRT